MTASQPDRSLPDPTVGAAAVVVSAAVRIVFALVVGAALSWALWKVFPAHLPAAADVVGYPTWANFNSEGVLRTYDVAVGVFPILVVALFVGVTFATRRSGLPAEGSRWRHPFASEDATDLSGDFPAWTLAAVPALIVGAVLGMELGIVGGLTGKRFVAACVAAALAYGVLAVAGPVVLRRARGGRGSTFPTTSGINVLASPILLLLVSWISSATSVKILSSGASHPYPWFPWWCGVGTMVIVEVVSLRALARAMRNGTLREIERRSVALLVVPVGLFLLLAALPGSLPPMDVFHDGEYLAAGKLVANGAIYWRDILSIHGLLEDVWTSQIGFAVFGRSRWGAWSAFTMLLNPASLVALYYLLAYLFWRRWLWLALFVAMAVVTAYAPAFLRYGMWPIALLTLSAAIKSRAPAWRATWSAVLAGLLVFQAIVAPETAYCLVGAGCGIIFADVRDWRRDRSIPSNLCRTLSCTIAGLACGGIFAVVLYTQHAIIPFINYYRDFVPGHELSGALPWGGWGPIDQTYAVRFFVAVTGLILAIWYFALRIYRGKRLTDRDLLIAATAIVAIIYFPKFFDRPDSGHLDEVYVLALPVCLFVLFKIGMRIEQWSPSGRWLHRCGAIAVILIVVTSVPLSQLRGLSDVANHYQPVAASPPVVNSVGFESPSPLQLDGMATDVNHVLQAYLRPGDWLFDFSNQPGLYYYLLDLHPKTQYYNVSMAEPASAQQQLVAQLETSPPKIVVFDDQVDGIPAWDLITNSVRHYDVSRYILTHYHPLVSVDTQLLYIRDGTNDPVNPLSVAPSRSVATIQGLYFDRPCDWGSLLNYLDVDQPGPQAESVPVDRIVATRSLALSGWVVDPAVFQPAWRAVAVRGGVALGYAVPDIRLASSGTPQQHLEYAFSGFTLPLPGLSTRDLSQIRVYGLSFENRIGPVASSVNGIGSQAGPAPDSLNLPTGSEPVAAGAVNGAVDAITTVRSQSITAPGLRSWSSYGWLQVTLPARASTQHIVVSNLGVDDPTHEISFDALPGPARTFNVPVASCPEWYGYGSDKLFVTSDGALAAPGLALVR